MNRSIRLALGLVASTMLALPYAATLRAQDAAPVDSTDGASTPPASPLRFSGNVRLFGQVANRRGTYQYTPDDFARLEFGPSVALYNVPFTLNVLLSTEQSTYRQSINSVSFDFDYHKLEGVLIERAYNKIGEIEALRDAGEAAGGVERIRDSVAALGAEKLRDLDRVKELGDIEKIKERAVSESLDKLDELGLVTGAERFFADFQALGVGVTYPNYSSLTLSGVPVTGFNVEWNPGKFYIAAAAGRSQQAITVPGVIGNVSGIVDSVLINPSYTRSLYAGRIGIGRKEGGHLIFTGVYAVDDQGSLAVDTVGAPLRPQANYVVGIDASVPIVEDYFSVQGELAGSMLTGDIAAADINQNDIPEFIRSTFDPNISSLLDYAFALKSTLSIPETDTRLTASLRKIGPVFFSLGVPTLRNDNLRFEGRLQQRFMKGRVSATAFYRSEEDNLSPGLKSVPSTVTAYGLGLGLNFPKLPYLRVEYAPYRQKYANLTDGTDVINTTTLISATSGYFYNVAGMNAGSTVTFGSQQSNTYQGLSDYGVTTIGFSQSAAFTFPLMVQVGLTHSSLATGDSTSGILSLDISGTYTAFNRWTNAAGLTLSDQSGTDNNLGFFVTSTVLLFGETYLEVHAEKNVYTNLLFNVANFDEFRATASVIATW